MQQSPSNTFKDTGQSSISDRGDDARDDDWRSDVVENNTVPENHFWWVENGRWFLRDAPDILNVNQSTAHDTIQDAVDEADTDDTIEVKEGTYEGGITVDVEGLTIQSAEGPENTVVLTGDHGDTIPDLGFSIRAHNVTVSGIGIEHPDN